MVYWNCGILFYRLRLLLVSGRASWRACQGPWSSWSGMIMSSTQQITWKNGGFLYGQSHFSQFEGKPNPLYSKIAPVVSLPSNELCACNMLCIHTYGIEYLHCMDSTLWCYMSLYVTRLLCNLNMFVVLLVHIVTKKFRVVTSHS